jgi:ABC-type transport system involved in multi-copper enzyme maturation permease subunit
MRTWRSPLAITVYVVILGGIGWAVFSAIAASVPGFGNQGNPGSPSNLGQLLFTFLIIFQVGLLAFITPALTSGAVSGERERQTIDLLFVTPLAPFSIIWGKLLASMSFVVVLLFLSVPIFSLVFLLGGIELDQVVSAFALTGVTALTLGVIGVAFSTVFRRSLAATVASYGGAFVLLIGSPVYGMLFPTEFDNTARVLPSPPEVALISPVVPLLVVASNQPVSGYGVRPSRDSQVRLSNGGSGFANGGYCTPNLNGGVMCTGSSFTASFGKAQSPGGKLQSGLFTGWQYWQASIVMQLMICAVALAISAFLLPPVRRLQPWRSGAPATA